MDNIHWLDTLAYGYQLLSEKGIDFEWKSLVDGFHNILFKTLISSDNAHWLPALVFSSQLLSVKYGTFEW